MLQQKHAEHSRSESEQYKYNHICYPFVKWAGGKTQLLRTLNKHIPHAFNQYFEPFLGGGAMFYYLSSKNLRFISYLSDTNEDLINAYKIVKNKVEELILLLERHEKEFNKSHDEYYYELRAKPPRTAIERAARFIALNKTCYNGLYRVNGKGEFNVPIGRYRKPVICDSTNLRRVSIALRQSKANITLKNYKDVLSKYPVEGDFVYLDPPYSPASETAYFTKYTHVGFTGKDQEDLADIFRILTDRNCRVLLSNSDTPFIRQLYKDFARYSEEVIAMRAINSDSSKRLGHKELLIRNYP